MAAHDPVVFKRPTVTLELISKFSYLYQEFRFAPLLPSFKMSDPPYSILPNFSKNGSCVNLRGIYLDWQI